ncbi:MAG: hypothetical protein ACR2HA_05325 [Nocardioides sp.]
MTPVTGADLTVPERFRGPSRSGNGGWTAGSLAERLLASADRPGKHVPVEVTLRQPPPLDTPLTVEHLDGDDGSLTVLAFEGARIAEARRVDSPLTPVDKVDPSTAQAAMRSYAGLRSHPFPGCFACGPDRADGDGLRIFPGPAGPGTVASCWLPHHSLAESGDVVDTGDRGAQRVGHGTTWAALDCVGGWSADLVGRPMVLGRMTARVDALPVVGEPHVVVGRRLRADGRKTFTASTLYDADGRVVGTAEHVWIAVDPATFS